MFGRPRRTCLPLRSTRLATWNVEGLRGDSSVKRYELIHHMREYDIDIVCIQETHLRGAEYFSIEGFTFFLSGGSVDAGRSHSGVGFVVSPGASRAVITFHAYTDRVACLKLKVNGGTVSLISVYCPHSGHDAEVRRQLFADLGGLMRKSTQHTTTLVLGDFNARLHRCQDSEHNVIGPHVFGGCASNCDTHSNGDLLLEFCVAWEMVVANTFFDYPAEAKVSYYDLKSKPLDPITKKRFAQLDHVLCHGTAVSYITDCFTDRSAALNSHHFLTIIEINISFGCNISRKRGSRKYEPVTDRETQKNFLQAFKGSLRAKEGPHTHWMMTLHSWRTPSTTQRPSCQPLQEKPNGHGLVMRR